MIDLTVDDRNVSLNGQDFMVNNLFNKRSWLHCKIDNIIKKIKLVESYVLFITTFYYH